MQVEWELSQTIKSLDGHGIRAAGAIVIDATTAATADVGATAAAVTADNSNNDNETKKTSDEIVVEKSQVDDTYRVICGNQMGSLCEYGIPSGLISNVISCQHDHSITAILVSDDHTIYVTGCKDNKIRVFTTANHTLITTFQGHEKTVSSLAWVRTTTDNSKNNNTFLVSGSWDGTAKVWDITKHSLIATLSGHENSVCVVGLLPPNTNTNNSLVSIATGSAGIATGNQVRGQSIRIWQVDTTMHTMPTIVHHVSNDHDGPIRDICYNTKILVSCSNDGTIKLRDPHTGVCVDTLAFIPTDQQHAPMFLSVQFLKDDDTIVASTDDGHVVLWNKISDHQYQQQQVIRHTQTVWNIVPLPNGDFGSCCQDGCFRIFTNGTDRVAPGKERTEFQEQVQDFLVRQQQNNGGPSSEEIAKLPHWENNYQKHGTSEGQVQLFQKNGIAIAAQWSMASQTWIEVGQVMGRPTDNDNTTDNNNRYIDGVLYDHVFPIEVDGAGGTVVTLQIGYNNGENQFVAAQRFMDAHQLPQYHLSEIADYIQQRTGGSSQLTLGTGGPTAVTGVPLASYQYIPSQSYKSFDLPNKNIATTFEKMKTKIMEFGLCPEDQLIHMDTMIATLIATTRYHSSKISNDEINAITKMLENHATVPSKIFPVLDLIRLLVLHPDAATLDRVIVWKKRIIPTVITICAAIDTYSTIQEGPSATAIPMLSLRLFANALKGGPGSRDAIVTDDADANNFNSILQCIELFIKSSNKNIRFSVATALYNICYYFHSSGNTMQADRYAPVIVPMLNNIIESKLYEAEPFHQVLISLGTIVMCSPMAKDAAKSLYMAMKVEPAASLYNNEDIKTTAIEVYSLLS